jgi:hypothetical protein
VVAAPSRASPHEVSRRQGWGAQGSPTFGYKRVTTRLRGRRHRVLHLGGPARSRLSRSLMRCLARPTPERDGEPPLCCHTFISCGHDRARVMKMAKSKLLGAVGLVSLGVLGCLLPSLAQAAERADWSDMAESLRSWERCMSQDVSGRCGRPEPPVPPVPKPCWRCEEPERDDFCDAYPERCDPNPCEGRGCEPRDPCDEHPWRCEPNDDRDDRDECSRRPELCWD